MGLAVTTIYQGNGFAVEVLLRRVPVRTVRVRTVQVKTVRKKRSGKNGPAEKNGPFVNGLCGNKGPSNQLPFVTAHNKTSINY